MEPATAAVSIVTPDTPDSIRTAFCNQVHFFATPGAAKEWLEDRPGAIVLPVAGACPVHDPAVAGPEGARPDHCPAVSPVSRA